MISLQAAVLLVVLSSSAEGETVLLDFYADWCGPCRQMDPTVRRLEAKGYPVRRVNLEQNRNLADKYGVNRVPTFLMLVDGQVVDQVVGTTSYDRLERMCKAALAGRAKQQARSESGASKRPNPGPVAIPAVRSVPAFAAASQPAAAASPDSHPTVGALGRGWRLASGTGEPTMEKSDSFEAHLIAVTVRLRIEDADGYSCGSGTIIDARRGEALILTCGHIFRHWQSGRRIQVDLFGPTPAQAVPGRLLSYDLEHDIGLVTICTPGPVATAQVAPPGHQVSQGDRVFSAGCNHGDPPVVRPSRVNSLNKFLGPPNLQVSGLPVVGRSGGGLFSNDGLVIGVCISADPSDNEGLYAAAGSIHAQLDRAKLSYVYGSGGDPLLGQAPLVAIDPRSVPNRISQESNSVRLTEVAGSSAGTKLDLNRNATRTQLAEQERATLDEMRRWKAEGAEVICIIRSRRDPRASSQIIVLDQVSPDFLKELAGEAQSHNRQHLTSLEISRCGSATAGSAAPPVELPRPPETFPDHQSSRPAPAIVSDQPPWRPHWLNPAAAGQ